MSHPAAADLHLHSEWSWDAPQGGMEESCRQARAAGLRVVAFTEHADYTAIAGGARLDVPGYLDAVARCRRQFPDLTIWSGVELGEPHRFRAEAAAVLDAGGFDWVLGSLHCVEVQGKLVESSELGRDPVVAPGDLMRAYFGELLALIRGPVRFQVLAHLEYPKRYWPAGWAPYDPGDYQEEIRGVLAAAAAAGLVLELNTSRGQDPERRMCPAPVVLRWWREAGGRAVSLGSDAHQPAWVAGGFALAQDVVAAAGFAADQARLGLWASVSGSGPHTG